ncbi:MAG: 30S ribosomal protein S9 [Muribaculaceae bacterium]|nr:30S ribosomal protein S9 [Bacteroidales bacterium]MDY4812172.1 30S ribosomal protein S9 [Muribaculaceae bacterium]
METVNAVGRRKAAVARVIVKEGNGAITINCHHDRRALDKYFPSSILQYIVLQPLKALDCVEKYDIAVNIEGGGYKGQAEALRLAIARALVKINPEDKSALRAEGFMTRDPRVVERKKPGQPKARKRFQFSKR